MDARSGNSEQLTGTESLSITATSIVLGYLRREILQLIISDHFPVTQLSFSRHRRVIGRE